jgi:lipopolysaccharide export system protein LptC
MPGQQQRVKDMTTHHTTIAKFTKPLSETFANISRTTIQHFEAKAQRARLVHDIKTLSAFDPHILKDIGMEGFDRLSPAQKESVFLNWSKHAARI